MDALIFGATGQVGRAVALELAQAGWQVAAVTRGRALAPEALALGVVPVAAGPNRAALVARGYDAVVDTQAFTTMPPKTRRWGKILSGHGERAMPRPC